MIGPPWTMGSAGAAWLVGIGLIAAAVFIVGGWPIQRLAAGALGVGILLRALIVEAPLLVKQPRNPNGWTVTFELVAMGGAALVLAGTTGRSGVSERVEIKVGRYLFAISLAVFGVQHFMYAKFIAGLVTAWIPWAFFLGGVCWGGVCRRCCESCDGDHGADGDDFAGSDVSAVGGGAACAAGAGRSA